MKKTTLAIAFVLCAMTQLFAQSTDSIRYHHEETDTAFVTRIINETRAAELENTAERVVFISKKFLGKPYATETLEGDSELLTINTSKVDCTTLVENVIALAMTTAEDTTTYKDYEKNLKSIRYRGGEVNGYASRLHYVSDWIADNTERGNFAEVTDKFAPAEKQQLRLNYMTTHRRSYKALVDNQEAYEEMQEVEKRYDSYQCSYIPKRKVGLKPAQNWLKEGDIVLITTTTRGLDVSHMGILVKERGQLFLLHASSNAGKVIIAQQSLDSYLKAHNNMSGIRVVRL